MEERKGLKIVFFSDPHGLHYESEIPDGDMIICSGDISLRGTRAEVREFLDWYAELPHKYKIFIAGNHDFWFEPTHKRNNTEKDCKSTKNETQNGNCRPRRWSLPYRCCWSRLHNWLFFHKWDLQ